MYKNKIKEFRCEKGFTLEDLANKVGISAGYLCHLEKGKRNNPSTEVMQKISIALDKSIVEIFFQT